MEGVKIKILKKIQSSEKELEEINNDRLTAKSVDASKNILLKYNEKQSYIEGLKYALKIIEENE